MLLKRSSVQSNKTETKAKIMKNSFRIIQWINQFYLFPRPFHWIQLWWRCSSKRNSIVAIVTTTAAAAITTFYPIAVTAIVIRFLASFCSCFSYYWSIKCKSTIISSPQQPILTLNITTFFFITFTAIITLAIY